jgi:hypothetical protein
LKQERTLVDFSDENKHGRAYPWKASPFSAGTVSTTQYQYGVRFSCINIHGRHGHSCNNSVPYSALCTIQELVLQTKAEGSLSWRCTLMDAPV